MSVNKLEGRWSVRVTGGVVLKKRKAALFSRGPKQP